MGLTKKELREENIEFTREQIAKRAIEIAELCANGSYKNAVACIGRMVSLSKAIDDEYWNEKLSFGEELEKYFILSGMREGHPDQNTAVN